MQGLLDGKVAVITGAGSGVGRAAVAFFTAQGASVIAADIDLVSAEESVRLAETPLARAVQCNVADSASVEAAVAAAVAAFGRLDIMFNNAGITVSSRPGGTGLRSLTELPEDEMHRVEQVNINGVIYGCQAAIRQFERQGASGSGGGAVVNTASIAGLTGYGGVLYGATKGAVVALTRTLAIEVAEHGIRVNSVCPAGMLTNYGDLSPDHPQAASIKQRMGQAHPLGRAIEPLETAQAAAFLASDLAANITGVNLPVDGGLTAGRKTGGG